MSAIVHDIHKLQQALVEASQYLVNVVDAPPRRGLPCGPLVGDAPQWAYSCQEKLAQAEAVECNQLSSIVVDNKVGELGGVVVEARGICGRH